MIKDNLIEALYSVEKRYNELQEEMAKPSFGSDIKEMTKINKEMSKLSPIVHKFKTYLTLNQSVEDSLEILEMGGDKELMDLAKMEKADAETRMPAIYDELKIMLLPKDVNDDKNVIMEIRGAAGGDEANIFAGDLYRMYCLYAETKSWKIDVMDAYPSNSGGYTLISFMIKGDDVYSNLKHENGIHRVQRVPKTESQGRVHTSTASVVVMPEIEIEEVQINKSDLRIDVYRSSGAGGQSVNTTDSAVRVTHIPTGISTASQEGRSQHDNKDRAMKQLAAKLWEVQEEERMAKLGEARQSSGTGARSEKIRTYNYPQNRVTDHRISLTLQKLDRIMEGDLEEIISALRADEQRRKMDEVNNNNA